MLFLIKYVPDEYKTQKMGNKVFAEDSFMLKYCLD